MSSSAFGHRLGAGLRETLNISTRAVFSTSPGHNPNAACSSGMLSRKFCPPLLMPPVFLHCLTSSW